MKNTAVLMLLTLLCGASALHAQTIEEVERELKAAQAVQTKRAQQDAANRAEQARIERQQAAVLASQATLLIRSDAACNLSVNAESKGELGAEQAKKIQVPAGDVLIECVSREDSAVKYSEVKAFNAQQNAVVLLELQSQLSALASERAAVADAQSQAESDAAELKAKAVRDAAEAKAQAERTALAERRFESAGDGVLKDTQTGLHWTQSDNDSDVNWRQAGAWCRKRGKGWVLPSVDELAGIYDGSSNVSTQCGGITCKVSSQFRLTSWWFWSSTPGSGSGAAWLVGLYDGERGSVGVSSAYRRALCVRRS